MEYSIMRDMKSRLGRLSPESQSDWELKPWIESKHGRLMVLSGAIEGLAEGEQLLIRVPEPHTGAIRSPSETSSQHMVPTIAAPFPGSANVSK
jgi:hypothetical protein